jgi:hypothetical protein
MYAYCQEMPGVSEEMASKVDSEVGDATVDGLIAHVSGPTPSGWRIIDVWESEEHFHRFQTERLHPALEIATGGATPPSRPFESLTVTGVAKLDRRG